jgi:uncharacterized repeat protein (TIGR01451 family)
MIDEERTRSDLQSRVVSAAIATAARIALFFLILASAATGTIGRADAATTSCHVATANAAHVLCWLDFTGFAGATGSQAFTIDLPDGSVLTGTIGNTGAQTVAPRAVPVYTGGAFGGVALGDEDYLGITGDPAFYAGGTVGPLYLTALTLRDPQGTVVPTVTIAAADAESLDQGDGANGSIAWATTGTTWAQLQLMANTNGSFASVCALSGVGTQNAKCVPNGTTNSAPAAAYILTTNLTNAQTVTMTTVTGSAQGFAYAVQLASLTVAKTVASREATGDQFTVQVTRAGTVLDTASTTGTGTAATTTGVVLPGDTYVLKDIAASGSTTNIANYATTVACANAVASATTLPASGTATQSVTIVPALDDQIACTFTNNALTLTDTAATPTKTVTAGTSVTDSFTLKNTSALAGTFQIVQPTIVAGGTPVTPTAYTFGGNTYTTLAALQTAIGAAGATAVNGTISVGVVYTVPGTSGTPAVVTLPATIAAGTGDSPQATASETDTITPVATLSISKTGTTAASPGGLIAYSILVSNAGPSPANGALFSDPMPTGIVVTGTPTCGTPTGGAVCGSVVVSTTTPQIVSSTITTLPVNGHVTFSITATAATAGTYTNTASVSPPSGTTGNVATSALTTVVSQSSGLQKSVKNITSGTAVGTVDTAVPGDTLRYTLTFTNTTGASISNVSFSDAVPTHTTFVAAACPASGGAALPAGVTCTPTSPAVGSTGTNVAFPFVGTIANGATISASIDVKVI